MNKERDRKRGWNWKRLRDDSTDFIDAVVEKDVIDAVKPNRQGEAGGAG